MLFHKNIFIFDLDGTLINSIQDVRDSINLALKRYGFKPLSWTAIKSLVGPDLKGTITQHVNDKRFEFELFEKEFVKIYKQKKCETTELYPGVLDTLKYLYEKNKIIYVLTNKPENQSTDIINLLGISKYIKKIIGPDTYKSPKPNPIGVYKIKESQNCNDEDMILIGDTEVDIETAKNANITSIAVTYGYRSKTELSQMQPDYFIENIKEIVSLTR